jgi:hypothetical protein
MRPIRSASNLSLARSLRPDLAGQYWGGSDQDKKDKQGSTPSKFFSQHVSYFHTIKKIAQFFIHTNFPHGPIQNGKQADRRRGKGKGFVPDGTISCLLINFMSAFGIYEYTERRHANFIGSVCSRENFVTLDTA